MIVQLPNSCTLITLLFALLRTGAVPVLAMPSQYAIYINALIALAEPDAYTLFQGTATQNLAKQVRDKHACLRHILSANTSHNERTFTPLFYLQGERCE